MEGQEGTKKKKKSWYKWAIGAVAVLAIAGIVVGVVLGLKKDDGDGAPPGNGTGNGNGNGNGNGTGWEVQVVATGDERPTTPNGPPFTGEFSAITGTPTSLVIAFAEPVYNLFEESYTQQVVVQELSLPSLDLVNEAVLFRSAIADLMSPAVDPSLWMLKTGAVAVTNNAHEISRAPASRIPIDLELDVFGQDPQEFVLTPSGSTPAAPVVTAVDDALYAAYYQPLGSSNPPTFRTVVLKIGEVIVDDVTGVHDLRWDYEERLQMREFLPEDGSVLSSAISATEDYIYVAMGIPWDETSESCIRLIKTTHPRLVSPGEDVPYSVEMPRVPDGVDGEQIAVVSDPNSEDVCLLFSDSGGVQLLFSATGGEHWAAPLLLAQADPESSQQIRLDLKFEPQTGLIHAVAIVDRGVRYWAYDSEIEEVVTESLIEDLNSSASVGIVCRENKGCTRGLDVPQPSIFVGADGTVFVSYGIGEGTGAVKIARKSARNRV